MTIKGSKLLAFLSFLAFVLLALIFISSPAFANHGDDHNKNNDNHKDKHNVVLNLSNIPAGGTNIINNNQNSNKNENKNDITITNTSSAQPIRIATVPQTLPATGAPVVSTLALIATLPLGFKLRKYKL